MKKSKRAVYAIDYETRESDNGKDRVYLVTYIKIFHNDNVINITNTDIEQVSHRYNIFDTLDNIISMNFKNKRDKQRNNKILLYWCNGARYDNYFTKAILLKHGFEPVLEKSNKHLKNKQIMILETPGTGTLNIVFKYDDVIFDCQDWFLQMPLSVDDMGKIVGVEKGSYKDTKFKWINDKGKIDWKLVNWDEFSLEEREAMIYYAKKDSLILGLYIQKHIKGVGMPKGLTRSTNAFCIAKEKTDIYSEEHGVKIKLKIWNEDIWTKHYVGGYNYFNANYLFKPIENAKEYDVNSMYNHNMTMPIPYDEGINNNVSGLNISKLLRINIISFKLKDEYIKNLTQGIIKVESTSNEKFKCVYNETCSSFPIRGVGIIKEIWDKEFEYVLKMYDIEYKIIEYKTFYLLPILKDYMIETFEERNRLKKEIKLKPDMANLYKILEQDCKVRSLSTYGKLGQADMQESYYYSEKEYKIGDIIHSVKHSRSLIILNKTNEEHYGNFKYITTNAEIPKYRNNIYIASYVTMIGRIRMYEHLISGMVLRIDTDGFTCLPSYSLDSTQIGNDLGQFKLEKDKMQQWFMLLGYKMYMWSPDKKYHANTEDNKYVTTKGVKRLVIDEGTIWDDIDWENLIGYTTHGKKVKDGVDIVDVKIELKKVKQLYQINKKNKA